MVIHFALNVLKKQTKLKRNKMNTQKVINKCLGRNQIVKVFPRTDLGKKEKYGKCVVCKKNMGVEQHGGHLCSLKCELEYSKNEEKYL